MRFRRRSFLSPHRVDMVKSGRAQVHHVKINFAFYLTHSTSTREFCLTKVVRMGGKAASELGLASMANQKVINHPAEE